VVLIIDDEESLQELLLHALERDGYRVLVAGTCAAGLSAFRTEAPDAVLLDVMLPDGSGHDVCRAIRAGVAVDRVRHVTEVDGAVVDLTYVEFEILSTLIASPGRVFSRNQLLDAVWGSSDFREPRTVDVHVRHLREKIEQDPAMPARIQTVRGVGYRFEG
jgi:DNA-binding response OmpR family regulator